jgi:predicted chitinase
VTWRENYATYGKQLAVDLVGNPDLALDPEVSARVLALYFDQRGVAEAARAGDWGEVRRRVQGAHAGLDRMVAIVGELERIS